MSPLFKFLLKNIEKGIIPESEDFDMIMEDLGIDELLELNSALLSYIHAGFAPNTQPEIKIEVDPTVRGSQVNIPQEEPPKHRQDPQAVLSPGQVTGNIMGNV